MLANKSAPSKTIKAAWIGTQIAWIMGLLGALGVIMLAISMYVFDFRATFISLPLEVEFSEETSEAFSNMIGSEGVLVRGFRELEVFGKDVDLQKHLMLMPLMLILLYLAVVYYLRKCLRNVKEGRPFDFNNAQYFRNAGLLVMIGGPVYGLMIYIYGMIGKHYVDFPGAVVTPIMNIHLEAVLAGLLILAFSQIYKEAIRIKAEYDFTV